MNINTKDDLLNFIENLRPADRKSMYEALKRMIENDNQKS